MMFTSRRMTFQLTPLLDLLLIVIFAQYMEVQQNANEAQAKVNDELTELQDAKTRLQETFTARKSELEAQYSATQQEVERQRQEYNRRFQSILDQHQRAGETLAQTFNLPGELLEQILKIRSAETAAEQQQIREAARRARELLATRGGRFIEFVVRLDEMQKHVSVWEIHLQQNGKAVLTDGQREVTVDFETEQEFVASIFQASKTFTVPKTLVIVLLSYGDTQFGLRRTATEAMPLLMDQLRNDADGTHWYDFSLLGYRPAGPVFSEQPQRAVQ
jgi:hypothetical protein